MEEKHPLGHFWGLEERVPIPLVALAKAVLENKGVRENRRETLLDLLPHVVALGEVVDEGQEE